MNTATKEQIKNDLANYVLKIGGQKQAELQLGVSNGTISKIVNDKWDNIADTMWLKIQNQVKQSDWMHSETNVSARLYKIYEDVKNRKEVRAVAVKSGRGKTHTAKRFVENNENAFLICCEQNMKVNDLLDEILLAIGKKRGNLNTFQSIKYIADELMKLDNPILIFDEFDKLNLPPKLLFISIFNKTEDKIGMVVQGVPFLKNSLERLANHNKIGSTEIVSRVNERIIELPENTPNQLSNIVKINGVTSEEDIIYIVNDADFSIRRLKSSTRVKLRKERKTA